MIEFVGHAVVHREIPTQAIWPNLLIDLAAVSTRMIRLLATPVSLILGLFADKTSAYYFFIILDPRTPADYRRPG